jgi:hypothetical protein
MMQASGTRVFFAGLLKAATGRLNLCMGGMAAAGALILESWLVFGVTAGSYAMAVMLDLWKPGLWRAVGLELRRRPPPLAHPQDLIDDEARSYARRLAKARDERQRALDAAPRPYRHWEQAMKVIEVAGDVERRATDLIATFERLAHYLSDKNLAKSRLQLEQASMWTAAPETKGTLSTRADREIACRVAEETVLALEALVAHKEAIGARIETLALGLEMLPHRILLAGMREEDARPAVSPSPLLELDAELRRLEEVAAAGADGVSARSGLAARGSSGMIPEARIGVA